MAGAISMLAAETSYAQRGNGQNGRGQNNGWDQQAPDRRGGPHRRQRQEIVRVPIRGEIFGRRGGRENGTLRLKQRVNQVLRSQGRHLSLKNMKLESVEVVAVSVARRSPNSVVSLYISGREHDFTRIRHNNGQRRMHRKMLFSRRHQQRGAWQLDFSAATRVRAVIVTMSHNHRGPGQGHRNGRH